MSHHLPCPVCQGQIPFDPRLLAQGVDLQCPNADCRAAIGIAGSSLPTFLGALDKLERLAALSAPETRAPRR